MLPPLLSNMACLFPQAWGWRSEKSSKQEIIEDDELLLQGGAIAPLHSLLSFSLNLDSVASHTQSSSADAFSDDLLYCSTLSHTRASRALQ